MVLLFIMVGIAALLITALAILATESIYNSHIENKFKSEYEELNKRDKAKWENIKTL